MKPVHEQLHSRDTDSLRNELQDVREQLRTRDAAMRALQSAYDELCTDLVDQVRAATGASHPRRDANH